MPVHLHSECLPDMRGKMGTPTFGFSLFVSFFLPDPDGKDARYG